MAQRCALKYLTNFVFLSSFSYVLSQSPSTNTPLPPLQWINLSPLLQGPPPPPLKDASIGYDETSRSLIVFGGEAQSGFVQSQTYLLNLDTLQWSRPTPPTNLVQTPPARSAAIAGGDFAASNRHGFVVIGGKGADGKGLSDIWEFDFTNQFWSEVSVSPGGPSPRWGASGGIDVRVAPVQDAVVPGPNNTFFLSGGFDGVNAQPVSDAWKLSIAGTLSSNLPTNSTASWSRISVGSNLPRKVGQSGTVIAEQVVIAGGCNVTTSADDDSCAQQDSYVIDTLKGAERAPGPCPAPRLDPVLIPNVNPFSTTFSSQVFLVLGTFDQSLWNDGGQLAQGEVAVLDTNTGSWTRVIPSGDPGSSGKQQFPTPRQGASSFSYPLSLVGGSRSTSSDTIVFGGRDATGKYLGEVWLLRSYAGSVASNNTKWSGFGDGDLESGVDASGAGVQLKYLQQCAVALAPIPVPVPVSPPAGKPHQPDGPTNVIPLPNLYNASVLHKALAPISLALLFPAILFVRLAGSPLRSGRPQLQTKLAFIIALTAYGLGAAGLAVAFTSITAPTSVPSGSGLHLKTTHGRVGLAFFVLLYAIVPIMILVLYISARLRVGAGTRIGDQNAIKRENGVDKMDTHIPIDTSATQSLQNASPPSSPRPRVHSWGPSSMWRHSFDGRMSASDNESVSSAGPPPPQRGFEVLNRPTRNRRPSSSWLHHRPEITLQQQHYASRSLGEIDWLQRRRSLNAVGELDYAISQINRAQLSSMQGTADALVTSSQTPPPIEPEVLRPNVSHLLFLLVTHISALALCVVALVALWLRAPLSAFVVFLAWTILFTLAMIYLTARSRPKHSTSIPGFDHLRPELKTAPGTPLTTTPQQLSPDPNYPFPPQGVGGGGGVGGVGNGFGSIGPYLHQPRYRATPLTATDEISHRARSVETEEDEDEDDETRQRLMEEELGRRDVSIVTVPKRKLWITNPS